MLLYTFLKEIIQFPSQTIFWILHPTCLGMLYYKMKLRVGNILQNEIIDSVLAHRKYLPKSLVAKNTWNFIPYFCEAELSFGGLR